MLDTQYKKIYESRKNAGEHGHFLDSFLDKVQSAQEISGQGEDWIKLDKLCASTERKFRYVLSLEKIAVDVSGNLYVSKDHALEISDWERARTAKKLESAQTLIFAIVAICVFMFVSTFFRGCVG